MEKLILAREWDSKGCMVKEMTFKVGREERVEGGGRDGKRAADRENYTQYRGSWLIAGCG